MRKIDTECQNLGLRNDSQMYILSRDRLNMDLDRACLELMIRLMGQEDIKSEEKKFRFPLKRLIQPCITPVILQFLESGIKASGYFPLNCGWHVFVV